MNLLEMGFWNLLQRPVLDRIFYVPFWECPFLCEFCCVDSLPGKPPVRVDAGESVLFSLVDALNKVSRKPIEVHLYGGEPLLKSDYILEFSKKLNSQKNVKKLVLYSTLRVGNIDSILNILPKKKLEIIVNPTTVTPSVEEKMKHLRGIAKAYKNVTIFPTGRGRIDSASYQKSLLEKIVPPTFPGRSCFATISGILVNTPHRTLHLCCLPQSPVIGDFESNPDAIVSKYVSELQNFHKKVEEERKNFNFSHACSVCEEHSQWKTDKKSTYAIP